MMEQVKWCVQYLELKLGFRIGQLSIDRSGDV